MVVFATTNNAVVCLFVCFAFCFLFLLFFIYFYYIQNLFIFLLSLIVNNREKVYMFDKAACECTQFFLHSYTLCVFTYCMVALTFPQF